MTKQFVSKHVGALCLAIVVSWSSVAKADPLDIVDKLFDELEAAGATKTSHGPLTYDPATRTVTIPDIAVEWPVSLSFGTAGSFAFTTSFAAPEISVTGLREVEGGFRMDAVRYGNGATASTTIIADDKIQVDVTVDDVLYEDIFWPSLPSVAFDANRPVSSYFPYLRWATKFDIARGVITSMTMAQTGPVGTSQQTTYDNIMLRDMVQGRVGEYRIERTSSESRALVPQPAPDGDQAATPAIPVRFETGPIIYRDYDLATFVRLIDPENYLLGNTDPDFHAVLEEASVDKTVISGPQFEVKVDSYFVGGVKMRQPAQSIFAFIDQAVLGNEPSEPEIAAFTIAMMRIIGIDEAWVRGIGFKAPQDSSGALQRIAMRGLSSDGIDEFTIEGLNVSGPQGVSFEFGRFLMAGLVFPDAEALITLSQHSGPGEPPVDLVLKALPMLNKSELRSVAATLPDGSKVSLDRYISEMSGHIPPFPTAWRERLDRLVLPAAVFNDEPELRAFVEALGLSEVRASAEMALRWDEKTQDLTIEPISIDVDDVAAATFEARVGGVPKLVFENPQAAQAALGTLAFTSAKFKLRNSRLVQTALAKFGADMGMSPEQVQEFVLGQVRQGLAALNSPAFAEEVLRAVSEFLADPRTMTVEARPQQAVPVMQILGLAAVAPQDIIRLLAVSITAQ